MKSNPTGLISPENIRRNAPVLLVALVQKRCAFTHINTWRKGEVSAVAAVESRRRESRTSNASDHLRGQEKTTGTRVGTHQDVC